MRTRRVWSAFGKSGGVNLLLSLLFLDVLVNYGGLAVVVSVVVWCESYKVVEFGVGWQQQQPHAQRGAEVQGAPSTQHPAPCSPPHHPSGLRGHSQQEVRAEVPPVGILRAELQKCSANGESLPCAKPSRRAETGVGRSSLSCCLPGTEMHPQCSLPALSQGENTSRWCVW